MAEDIEGHFKPSFSLLNPVDPEDELLNEKIDSRNNEDIIEYLNKIKDPKSFKVSFVYFVFYCLLGRSFPADFQQRSRNFARRVKMGPRK